MVRAPPVTAPKAVVAFTESMSEPPRNSPVDPGLATTG